jgi:hypothetical protein
MYVGGVGGRESEEALGRFDATHAYNYTLFLTRDFFQGRHNQINDHISRVLHTALKISCGDQAYINNQTSREFKRDINSLQTSH